MQTPILLTPTSGAASVSDFFLSIIFTTFLLAWIWSFFHCIFNEKIDLSKKIIGAILIVTLAHVGSLIYLFLPRENKTDGPLQT